MKKFVLIITTLLLCLDLPAQITFSGRVQHDDEDPFVVCLVRATPSWVSVDISTAFTDSLGYYKLQIPNTNVPITLHFEELLYFSRDTTFTVTPKTQYTVDMTLEAAPTKSMAELSSLPATCIKCGSDQIVPVIYGQPSERGWELIKNKKLLWGVGLGGANYGCVSCGQLYVISQ